MQALASDEKMIHCSVFRVQTAHLDQIEAQRSGFNLERRSDGVSELWPEAEANDTKSTQTTRL